MAEPRDLRRHNAEHAVCFGQLGRSRSRRAHGHHQDHGDRSNVANSPQYIPVSLTVSDPGFVVYPTQTTIWQKIGAAAVTREIEIVRPSTPTAWVATALPLSAAAGLEEKLASGEAKVTETAWLSTVCRSRRLRGWSSRPIPARHAR